MHADDYVVPPRRRKDIAGVAARFRAITGTTNEPRFPIIEALELVLAGRLGWTEFEVRERHVMGIDEGHTYPDGSCIVLREDVYENACRGQGRAVFTAAHEAGHFFLHTGHARPFARRPIREVKPYMRAEWQANTFAAELLMPEGFINPYDRPNHLTRRFGVSTSAAECRLTVLYGRGR